MTDHATLQWAEQLTIKADVAAAVAKQTREGLCSRCGGRRSVARLALIPRAWYYNGRPMESPATPTIADFPCPACTGIPLPPRLNPV